MLISSKLKIGGVVFVVGVKIVTKEGDRGYTQLYGGKKARKDDVRFEALGSLDELSSFFGVLISKTADRELREIFASIQHSLYLIMSLISGARVSLKKLEKESKFFEQKINKIAKKQDIKNRFVLPQGNEFVNWLHVVRAITRKCERRVVSVVDLKSLTKDEELVLKYLNRLSDFLFALAISEGQTKFV